MKKNKDLNFYERSDLCEKMISISCDYINYIKSQQLLSFSSVFFCQPKSLHNLLFN